MGIHGGCICLVMLCGDIMDEAGDDDDDDAVVVLWCCDDFCMVITIPTHTYI